MIKTIAESNKFVPVADEDIALVVQNVLSSLTLDGQSFSRACQQYNLDFFRGETENFRTTLCQALDSFFSPQHQNAYWKANRGTI